MTITPLTIAALTTEALNGTGVFDVLMRANKAHLDEEFTKNRIRGPEYATVYLGSVDAVLKTSLQFLVAQQEVLKTQQEIANLEAQALQIAAQTAVSTDELLTSAKNRAKSDGEIALLAQKTVTELAQTTSATAEADSVIGKQKTLYQAQTDGFARDAEQKAAKVLVDTWSVRRTTDETTIADDTNHLEDEVIGRAVTKLLFGVGA